MPSIQTYQGQIITSIYGRRLGLQRLSTAQSGGRLEREFLVGMEDIRVGLTTSESTGTNLSPTGISTLIGTSAASSAVYVLDPPIPSVRKVINFGSTINGPLYVRTKNAETIQTSGASTSAAATVILSSAGGTIELIGYTTAIWLAVNCPSTLSGISFAATT